MQFLCFPDARRKLKKGMISFHRLRQDLAIIGYRASHAAANS
jgi:hypothetical protein